MAKAKKLPSGNWRVLVYTGKDDEGKRQYKSFTAQTRREAEYAASEFALNMRHRRNAANMTVGEAINAYIESKSNVLSPSTVVSYRKIRWNDFQDLMDIPLSKLDNDTIQRVVNIESGAKSPKSIRNAHGLLSSALKTYHGSFALNTTLPQKEKPSIFVPTEEDIRTIYNSVVGTDIEIAFLLATYLGLRRSEICALTYRDIDFDKRLLTINKAMVVNENREWIIKQPKSYAGYRILPLPDFIYQKLGNPSADKNTPLVDLNPDVVTKRFSNVINQIPHLTSVRFHDLRHYNASVMLAQNIPNRYAQERLGHATDNMLKTVYQHVFEERQKEISEELNSYFDSIMQHEMQHTRKY